MWTHCVEVPPPCFDDDLGLAAGAEPLDAQTLVAKLTERLAILASLRYRPNFCIDWQVA